MNKQNIIKNILIAIVVAAAFFLLYKFLVPAKKANNANTKSSTQGISTSTPMVSGGTNIRDVDLLRSRLGNIKVNTSIFSSIGFSSLKDDRKTIPKEPVGRDNPFAKTQ